MERVRAAAGSAVFLVLVPGVIAGLVPWLLTGYEAEAWWLPLRVAGGVLLVAGVAALVHSFARFVLEGLGTPAPVAPTRSLVVGGLYRRVRNPMYLSVTAAIVGQALLLGSPALLVEAALFVAATASFVRWHEEPSLHRRFGAEYDAYREAVPGWRPRLTPWRPGEPD
jgi:protein-S-isoprenylcysteine O-methyltransferase Ste14